MHLVIFTPIVMITVTYTKTVIMSMKIIRPASGVKVIVNSAECLEFVKECGFQSLRNTLYTTVGMTVNRIKGVSGTCLTRQLTSAFCTTIAIISQPWIVMNVL